MIEDPARRTRSWRTKTGKQKFLVQVSDVKSTNGTFIDGRRVARRPGVRVELKHGSRLVLGSFRPSTKPSQGSSVSTSCISHDDNMRDNGKEKKGREKCDVHGQRPRLQLSEVCYQLDTKTKEERRMFRFDLSLRSQQAEQVE